MLQGIRDNAKGTISAFLIGFLVLIFAISGSEGLSRIGDSAGEAASVNGEAISEQRLRIEVAMQKQQMINRFGNNLPEEFISEERLREPVLQRLIDTELSNQSAAEQNMIAPPKALNQMVLSAESFQQDGKFSEELLRLTASRMYMTPLEFIQWFGNNIVNSQLQQGLMSSNFTLPNELAASTALSLQTRDFSYVSLSKDAALKGVETTDAEVDSYYEANKSQFVQAEQTAIEYIELTPAALASDTEASEEEINAQYQQNLELFEAAVERHAAHILLELKDDGSEKSKLLELQAKLAAGEDFAELAKQYSDDVGSSESGGDLGFSAGDTFPEAFEDTLAALSVGQVSEAVETDSGIHIIKLLDIRGDKAPSLEEQKPAIVQALMRSKAEAKFSELLDVLAEQSYNAESLAEVGAELNLPVSTTELFGRSGGSGLTANAKVLEAAFSDDVLLEGNSSELLELNDQRVVVLKRLQHVESHIKEKTEVMAEIVERLKSDKAEAALAGQGSSLIAQLQQGGDFAAIAEKDGLELQQQKAILRSDSTLSRDIVEHVFALSKPQGSANVSGLTSSEGDYIVLSLSVVNAGSVGVIGEETQNSVKDQLASQTAATEYQLFRAGLKGSADIEIR